MVSLTNAFVYCAGVKAEEREMSCDPEVKRWFLQNWHPRHILFLAFYVFIKWANALVPPTPLKDALQGLAGRAL